MSSDCPTLTFESCNWQAVYWKGDVLMKISGLLRKLLRRTDTWLDCHNDARSVYFFMNKGTEDKNYLMHSAYSVEITTICQW